MKKFLVLLLAALMVFSFAACGGGGGGEEEAAADDAMKVAMVQTSPSTRQLMRLARHSVRAQESTSHIKSLHLTLTQTVFLQSKKLSKKATT